MVYGSFLFGVWSTPLFWWVCCAIELDITNIEFHMAFFYLESHIRDCHHDETLMKLNISEVKFHTELELSNIEF